LNGKFGENMESLWKVYGTSQAYLGILITLMVSWKVFPLLYRGGGEKRSTQYKKGSFSCTGGMTFFKKTTISPFTFSLQRVVDGKFLVLAKTFHKVSINFPLGP
jgi:hypothetical protein